MGKTTGIEWCDATCNCFWGCTNGCAYCAARKFARRFGKHLASSRGYSSEAGVRMAEFKPTFLPDQLKMLDELKKPSKIFMSFMGDPFEENFELPLKVAFSIIWEHPQHTILMLTKKPQNLLRHSPFPENVWVGVSCTDDAMLTVAWKYLKDIKASVKFISFEPLLSWGMSKEDLAWTLKTAGISWVICGAQSPYSVKTTPKPEWVKTIVEGANSARTPVFLKNNLHKVFERDAIKKDKIPNFVIPRWAGETSGAYRKLRQEFPKVKEGGK